MNYVDYNADIWDHINECLVDKSTALSHEEYLAAKDGALDVTLAGKGIVPREWFPPLKGLEVLGLACGGGQQCPVFAAHGANVTVADISERQLANEKYVAEREGYDIAIVKADMSKPLPFADRVFDMIFHPVANCYIENILPLWSECARVMRTGGVLMMAYVKEEFFLFEPDFQKEDFLLSRHTLPFHPLRDLSQAQIEAKRKAQMPLAFSHTLTEQIGGLIKAGFEITDIFEDGDGGGLFDRYMNSYVAVRAVRK
ncbi:MAG: class I SAM-dependent methyltransferase [Acetatifactor sp.]|nr:class I SAM-dependent methyltransferase [Acetatifactor sp.]MDE5951163.1 class I SAM-dependent methyltransferase [Acetatifactor sp.]